MARHHGKYFHFHPAAKSSLPARKPRAANRPAEGVLARVVVRRSADAALPPRPDDGQQAPYEWLHEFDQIQEPIFVHDKHFRILRCNAAYAECARLPMNAIIGQPYWQVFPKVPGPQNNCVDALASTGTALRSEFTTEAGQVFLTHDITAHKDSGEFWYSRHLMENITARKHQENLDRWKNSFSEAIIGSAPGIFVVVDRQQALVRWNSELSRLTGRSDAELQATSLLALLPEGHRSSVTAKLEEALTNGGAQGELRLQCQAQNCKDFVFTARSFEVAGESYIVAFCIDKSDVKQLQQELLREKTLADTIIESAPGAFFMIDQQTNLMRWNKYLGQETGLSEEQLRDSSILSAIHPDDRELASAKFLAAFATGYGQMEVRVPTADQGLRVFLKTARRFTVDDVPYLAGFCFDITDRKQAEAELGKEKVFFEALIEGVPGAFYVVDQEGNYLRWNSYLNRLTGLKDSELLKRPALLTIHEEDRPLAAATMQQAFEQGYAQAELRVLTRDRGVRLFFMTARRFRIAEASYLVGVGIDTTEWLAKLKELEHDAWTDPLTQVANRGHFLDMARKEFARCRRYGQPLSLWMLDIDHFKAVNDTYGHHAGDIALQALVSTSLQALRDWDILGRMGGEEFAVLLPETESTQALLVAERLRQIVAAASSPVADGKEVHLTVSIGIATAHDDDPDLETLLDRADQALYEAKRTGRDKVRLAEHSPAM